MELNRNAASGLVTLNAFDCADLFDPDAIIDLLSAHRVATDPAGNRVLVSALSPVTDIVYETEAYNAYREALPNWPDIVGVFDLIMLLDALPGAALQPSE